MHLQILFAETSYESLTNINFVKCPDFSGALDTTERQHFLNLFYYIQLFCIPQSIYPCNPKLSSSWFVIFFLTNLVSTIFFSIVVLVSFIRKMRSNLAMEAELIIWHCYAEMVHNAVEKGREIHLLLRRQQLGYGALTEICLQLIIAVCKQVTVLKQVSVV